MEIKRAHISDLAQIAILTVALIAGWYKFDNRISMVERAVQQQQAQSQKLADVMDKLDITLEKFSEQLSDFPLHRHLRDGIIAYPGGTTLTEDDFGPAVKLQKKPAN